jgi:hypothetical protein
VRARFIAVGFSASWKLTKHRFFYKDLLSAEEEPHSTVRTKCKSLDFLVFTSAVASFSYSAGKVKCCLTFCCETLADFSSSFRSLSRKWLLGE